MSDAWRGGSTTAWRKVRAFVLARDAAAGWRCRAHDQGWCARAAASAHTCTSNPTVAHHTLGRAVSGDDPAHIVASCAACNLAIGDPAAAADPQPTRATKW